MTWYLDGVNLSTLAWNIKHRSAGWSVPGKSGENVRIPGRHGSFWTPNKTYDEGTLTLSMWAAGCNEDGTIPMSEDAKKKVRDNLDKLTSMFSTSRRLLNLRQVTGPDSAMVNETTNPTMVATTNTGNVLADNALVDPTRLTPVTTEVSRNLSTNPYLKGRTSTKVVYTEDIYPDPIHEYNNSGVKNPLMTSYYYPINQDAATTNQFFTPSNGFSLLTGMYGGRGVIRRPGPISWSVNANVGFVTKEVTANRDSGVVFFVQIKLNGNAPASSVNVLIKPEVSDNGVNWTAGTNTATVALNKSTYTWIMVPATSLPAMGTGPVKWWVRYNLQVIGSSSWNGGDAFDIQYMAIQDSPPVGNPWRDSPTPSMMIIDKETTGAVNRGGTSQMGATDFLATKSLGWEAVISPTSAPYSFAWMSRDSSRGNKGNVNFTVYGGTSNTFRRVLPSPTMNQSGVGIWGTFIKNVTAPVVVRLTERTGSPGSYVYTTRGTVSITSGTAFSSSNFDLIAGKTYCLEVDVPAGTKGLNPSITFRELHVSNASLSTTLPRGASSTTSPTGVVTKYTGSMYNSTIVATGFAPFGAVSGVPTVQAKDVNAFNVDWAKEPQGLMTRDGVLDLGTYTFPSGYVTNSVTFALKTMLTLPPHISNLPLIASSGTASLVVTKFDSSNNIIGSAVSYTLSGQTGSAKSFEQYVEMDPSVAKIAVGISYTKGTPRSELLLIQFHAMVNRTPGITSFTGASTEASAKWGRVVSWSGKPYFSESSLAVGIPESWTIPDFGGFDTAGNILAAKTLRISTSGLMPGTAKFGFRRGAGLDSYSVSVVPQGGTSQVVGNISTSTSYVITTISIPDNATYIDINFSGNAYRPVSDVFLMQKFSGVWPSTGWYGFTQASIPSIALPEHPSRIRPTFSVVRSASKTLSAQTGVVPGWSGPVLSGGYLVMPANAEVYTVDSASVQATSGFVSVAARIQTEADMVGKITLRFQQSPDGESWTTTRSIPVDTSGYKEYKLVDSPVNPTTSVVRVSIEVNNVTSPTTRSGTAAIVDGVAIVTSPGTLGSNFPGYFVGVRGSDGVSQYMGHIRQTFVEVVESIDMESQAYGTIAEFNVNLVVPSAFWEDVYDTTQQISAVGASKTGTMLFSSFKGATAPMQDVIIEITPVSGSITELTLEDKASGNFVKYSGPAQGRIIINSKLSSVVDVNSKSIIRYISGIGSSNIMTLTPYRPAIGEGISEYMEGVPVVNWSSNVPVRVKVTGRRKYLLA